MTTNETDTTQTIITDLSPYNGKVIKSISAVDSQGKIVNIAYDRMVIKDNRLDCLSACAALGWNDTAKAYLAYSIEYKGVVDIAGFYDIVVDTKKNDWTENVMWLLTWFCWWC